MSVTTIEQLKQKALEIKNETREGYNTANRIGTFFTEVANNLETFEDEAAAEQQEAFETAEAARDAKVDAKVGDITELQKFVMNGSSASSETKPYSFTVGGYIKGSGIVHVSNQTSATSNNLSYINNQNYTKIKAHIYAKTTTDTQKGCISFFAETSHEVITDVTAPISCVITTLTTEGFTDIEAEIPEGTKTIVVYTAIKESVATSTVQLFSPAVKSLDKRVEELENNPSTQVNISNYNGYQLPKNPTTLKILSVGNSYVQVPMQRLTEWLSALGITNVIYGYTYHSGATLKQYSDSVDNNTAFADFYISTNGGDFVKTDASTKQTTTSSYASKLTDVLSYENWDVITFQQGSTDAHKLGTITPYLPKLINTARIFCSNAGVKIAWHSTHAHAVGYSDTLTQDAQTEVYNGLVSVAKYLETNYGIDLIIPSSTFLQNLRSIDNSFWVGLGTSTYEGGATYKQLTKGSDTYTGGADWCDFTSDGTHINRYTSIGVCALFVQLLINACFGKSIKSTYITDWHYAKDQNMLNCQSIIRQCAFKAINSRYTVSTIDTTSFIY